MPREVVLARVGPRKRRRLDCREWACVHQNAGRQLARTEPTAADTLPVGSRWEDRSKPLAHPRWAGRADSSSADPAHTLRPHLLEGSWESEDSPGRQGRAGNTPSGPAVEAATVLPVWRVPVAPTFDWDP